MTGNEVLARTVSTGGQPAWPSAAIIAFLRTGAGSTWSPRNNGCGALLGARVITRRDLPAFPATVGARGPTGS